MQIAYLTSTNMLPNARDRRADGHEHDLMMTALRPAFAAAGLALSDLAWDDANADWSSFDAVIVGTTWDYWDREPQFHATLARIDAATRLFNPAKLIRWNANKRYLRQLEARGARLIPTLWLDDATPEAVHAAFDALQTDDLVLKRQVGAGAHGQHRLKRGDAIPPLTHAMMAQPFMRVIQTHGETSLVVIDGALSHALVKRPAAGDYRIQSIYGGVETAITPGEAEIAAASATVAMLDEPPLYARVDVIRGDDGGYLLMELELIEPYLYPAQGPRLGALLADATLRRLQ